jgi:hypothetical protein
MIKHANLAEFNAELEIEKIGSRYDAISYVWGEPNFTHTLYCDYPKSHIKIMERLYDNLLRLHEEQRRKKPRLLWIDAVCIDQENLIERSVHVQFMTHIYCRASQTHIFLGGGAGSWFESEWFSDDGLSRNLWSHMKS